MLKVENLRKQYKSSDGTKGGGVLGVSFDVAEGEFFTLLGPSGCGKTTTLRSVAGLEEPDEGHIALGGTSIFNSSNRCNIPPYGRDIGMVFQSYAIWPHMSVAENVAYPLKASRKRLSTAEIRDKVRTTLRMVGMESYIDRAATQLSGGQQQRLALARALTREPKLLLLDEPLSNLDAQLRDQMRAELQRLQREWGVTSIYVTHDQSEALSLSDRIAVMNGGVIVQLGSPKEIYRRPTSEFVANFIGRTNLIDARTTANVGAETTGKVTTEMGPLTAYFPTGGQQATDIKLAVRPEEIDILGPAPQKTADLPENQFVARIESEVFQGEITEYAVGLGAKSQLIIRTHNRHDVSVGDDVLIHMPPAGVIALAKN